MIARFHELGLAVDLEALGIPESGFREARPYQRNIDRPRLDMIGSFSLRFFADSREACERGGVTAPDCFSPAGDMRKLISLLEAAEIGTVVRGWNEE